MNHKLLNAPRSSFVIVTILLCAIASQSVQAALFFYEPFSKSVFTDGFMLGKPHTPEELKNGWSRGNATTQRGDCSFVSSGSALSYEGLATESDSYGVARSTNASDSNRNAGRPFDVPAADGSVYCSFLLEAKSLPTANRCLISLNHSTGSSGFNNSSASVWLDAKGCLLIGKSGPAHTPDTTAEIGDKTVFVVLKYTFKEGSDNDEVSLYLNPEPGQPEPSKPAIMTVSGQDAKELVMLGLPQGNEGSGHGADSGVINMDEIRVGTAWADVTPAAKGKTAAKQKKAG